MSYEDPVSQRVMVMDDHRNAAYRRAMESVIGPDSVVLDLGAGLGVLGLMAAQLGAAKVYLVEPVTPLTVASQLAEANGVADRIEFIQAPIEQAVVEERVDVILSVFTGNFLLEEDLLPSLFYARDKYLSADGVLLPGAAKMIVQPVCAPAYRAEQVDLWKDGTQGIDHSTMHRYAVNSLYHSQFNDVTYNALAAPEELMDLDFHTAQHASCKGERVCVTASSSGELHGFLGWFDMQLGSEWFTTGPDGQPTHWAQVFLPVDPVLQVQAGDNISFQLDRPEYGEWSWHCEVGERSLQHSTFLSRPVSPRELALHSEAYQPEIGTEGRLIVSLVSQFDGGKSVAELARWVGDQAPGRFASHEAAVRWVQKQVARFCDR